MHKKHHIFIVLALLFLITASLGGCSSVAEKRKSAEVLYKEGIDKMEGKKSLFDISDFEGAAEAFEEIKSRYSFTSFAPLAELRLADIHFMKGEYTEALTEYDGFMKLHPNHKEVPYAIYQMGLSYFNQIGGVDRDLTAPEGALGNFETLIGRFPDNKYSKDAAEKISICKDLLSGNELYIGKFYYRKANYKAAIGRFQMALERYPGYGPKEEALLYLGKSYLEEGMVKKGKEALKNLVSAFPKSEEAKEAGRLLQANTNDLKEHKDE
ncbi:MAG: outer membrane protein assembly factor BamD [Deltaproteobacteria bacterium]|nr:outer membrane protein assembly factor BamD [Deltaproteobacteria bacterium]